MKNKHIPWNKGLTGDPTSPNYDPRIEDATKMMINTKKGMNLISWNKGKTNDPTKPNFDPRVGSPWKGKKRSKSTLLKMSKAASKSLKGHYVSVETRKKISDSLKGHEVTTETRLKIGKANKGKWANRSYEEQALIREKCRQKSSNFRHSEETRALLSELAKKQWKNQRERMLASIQSKRNRKPTSLEKNFQILCDKYRFNNIIYVGDGDFWITVPKGLRDKKTALNPDFIVAPFSKTRKVIETIGLYWHPSEETEQRNNIYNELGISCLFVSDDALYNNEAEIIEKVSLFLE